MPDAETAPTRADAITPDAERDPAMETDDSAWINDIANAQGPSRSHEAQIHKVPEMLLANEGFAKNYKPHVVSIGPYHYNNPKLRHAAFKHKMTRKFAESIYHRDHQQKVENLLITSPEQLIKEWYDAIKTDIDKWRKCYEDETTCEHSNQTLSRILLLDGCSTLHYIDTILQPNHHEYFLKHMQMKSHEVALVQQDMFLLENQLPYGVLKMLMGEKHAKEWKEKITSFITKEIIKLPLLISTPENPDDSKQKTAANHSKQKTEDKYKDPDPAHLLDFLRKLLLNGPKKNGADKKVKSPIQERAGEFINKLEQGWPCKRERGQKTDWHTFRNIKDLTTVGIKMRRSSTCILGDITFRPWCMKGHLHLPPIVVDDTTAARFLNLVAYEMCPGTPNDFGVTSYICFLESLIDHPDDVKKLRDAGILHNSLGSDQEVTDLFNKIGTDLVPNDDLYTEVRMNIQSHYDNKLKAWVAKNFYDHFSTPWTYTAVLATLLALAITSLQTWYTIFPLDGPCDGLCKYLKPKIPKT